MVLGNAKAIGHAFYGDMIQQPARTRVDLPGKLSVTKHKSIVFTFSVDMHLQCSCNGSRYMYKQRKRTR